MNFLNYIENRYTTKMYSGERLQEAQIAELQEILRLSPSSINGQPWHFSFVGNQELIKELSEASYFNKERIEHASHIIVLANLTPEALLERFNQGGVTQNGYVYFKENILPKGDEHVREWMARQVYIALGMFLSACATMGIDATPMEGIDKEKYNQILGFSKEETLVAVAIGKRHVDDKNQLKFKPKQRLPKEQVIKEYN